MAVKFCKISNGEIALSSEFDLYLVTTDNAYTQNFTISKPPIPKDTRIKVHDIVRNFYGIYITTYYKGEYYYLDPAYLKYIKED